MLVCAFGVVGWPNEFGKVRPANGLADFKVANGLLAVEEVKLKLFEDEAAKGCGG